MIVKFRTMDVDAESRRDELLHLNELDGGPLFKIKGEDPRITRVGGFLRSLEHRRAAAALERAARRHEPRRPAAVRRPRVRPDHRLGRRRLETTPGITGPWQVLGRNDVPFEEMVKLDYVYVTNWSLWWDVRILCQTIPVVLSAGGPTDDHHRAPRRRVARARHRPPTSS